MLKGLEHATAAGQNGNTHALSGEALLEQGPAGFGCAQQLFELHSLADDLHLAAGGEARERIGAPRLDDDRRAELGQHALGGVVRPNEAPGGNPHAGAPCQFAGRVLVEERGNRPIVRNREPCGHDSAARWRCGGRSMVSLHRDDGRSASRTQQPGDSTEPLAVVSHPWRQVVDCGNVTRAQGRRAESDGCGVHGDAAAPIAPSPKLRGCHVAENENLAAGHARALVASIPDTIAAAWCGNKRSPVVGRAKNAKLPLSQATDASASPGVIGTPPSSPMGVRDSSGVSKT